MRARAAGHDRVVPVLPAAAGRAPLPRPLRYRPRVLTGGCQARACLGRAPRGLGRRAALPALRPPSPGSAQPRWWEAAPGPRAHSPDLGTVVNALSWEYIHRGLQRQKRGRHLISSYLVGFFLFPTAVSPAHLCFRRFPS